MREETIRGTILIETDGARVGQVNGLAVMSLGGFAFGHPSRITARVRLGKGELIDIEREVKLGGPIHSKGVLILHGFIAGRYALDHPLSLSASLVFEQSYGGIEATLPRGAWEEPASTEIFTYEETKQMPYVTTVERAGYQRGEANLMLWLIEKKFGETSANALRERVASADSDTLRLWSERILTAETPDALFQ